jgi:hypothetical protein
MMDLLLPDTILKILKLLWDSPESIVAFSLSCSQAQQLCSDRHLWGDLCRSITDALPGPLRSVDWLPSEWNVASHRELYIRLLQPYKPLLQQRVWHTTKMPAGQLLVFDAEPPFVWGRSVFFRSLQGCPFAHAVFVISLPHPSKVDTGSLQYCINHEILNCACIVLGYVSEVFFERGICSVVRLQQSKERRSTAHACWNHCHTHWYYHHAQTYCSQPL